MGVVLEATIVCPVCGESSRQTMPTDACQWLYTCPHCETVSRPLPGDCCVFCSYGDHRCPPNQTSDAQT